MSLDVTLVGPRETVDETCPHCGRVYRKNYREEYYDNNITHNLGLMAEEAGIYEALWRPEEIGITKAGQLVPLLREGIYKLLMDPDHYKTFDAPNGWGKYDHLVKFVQEYMKACSEHPDADIEVSR